MADRRSVILGLGSAFALPRFGLAQQNSVRDVRITHAVTSLAFIQSYVADQKGFFEEVGLKAQLVDTGGGGPDVQLVLSGRAELTVNDGAQVFPALLQGQRLTCVLSLLNRSIVNVTMRKETADRLGIKEDTPFSQKLPLLKGLRIGVTRAGALTWQLARFNLIGAGLNPEKDAQVVAIGGPPALAAALDKGAVDVIYISMPVGEKLVQEGKAVTFIDNARGEDPKLSNFMMEGLWAAPESLSSKKELVAAAVKAYAKASAFVVSSGPEEVAAAVMPVLGSLGEAVLIDAIKGLQPAVSRTGRIEEAEFQATQEVLRVNGFLARSFELREVFDPSFIKS